MPYFTKPPELGTRKNWKHTAKGIECWADLDGAQVFFFDFLSEEGILAWNAEHALSIRSSLNETIEDLERKQYILEEKMEELQDEIDEIEERLSAINKLMRPNRSIENQTQILKF